MNHARVTIAALLVTVSTAAYSFDTPTAQKRPLRDLFRNTKEDRSILVSAEQAQRARTVFGRVESSKINAVTEKWFQSFQNKLGTCEPVALTRLQKLLEEAHLPSDSKDTVAFLHFLRAEDRMDDVILYPVLRTATAWAILGFEEPAATPGSKPTEVDPGKRPRKKDVLAHYFSNLNPACPTAAYATYLSRKQQTEQKRFNRDTVLSDIQSGLNEKVLAPHYYAWFLELYRAGADQAPYTLENVYPNYVSAKDSMPAPQPKNAPPEKRSSYLTQKVKGKNHTRRMALYAAYDAGQMEQMALVMRRMARRLYSKPTIRFETDKNLLPLMENESDADLTETVRGTDVLDYAVMKLLDEKKQLLRLPRFQSPNGMPSVQLDLEDLVLAAVETGIARGNDVDQALAIEEIWEPKKTTGDKIKGWARRVLGPAAILIPPPFNMVASIGMVLAESFLLKEKQHELPVFPGSSR